MLKSGPLTVDVRDEHRGLVGLSCETWTGFLMDGLAPALRIDGEDLSSPGRVLIAASGIARNTGAVLVPYYDSEAETGGESIDTNFAITEGGVEISSWQIR